MLYFNRSTQTSACVLGPAQPRLPPVSESVVRLEVTFHHCRRCHLHHRHHHHVHHHGRAGGVADPHGEEGSWEHEAKKHLCKKENQKKHLCKKKKGLSISTSPLRLTILSLATMLGVDPTRRRTRRPILRCRSHSSTGISIKIKFQEALVFDFPTERLLQLKLV